MYSAPTLDKEISQYVIVYVKHIILFVLQDKQSRKNYTCVVVFTLPPYIAQCRRFDSHVFYEFVKSLMQELSFFSMKYICKTISISYKKWVNLRQEDGKRSQ